MPGWLLLFVLALPAALVADAAGSSPLLVFILAALALIPMAGLISVATDALAERLGPTLGGLLNATFGNAAELIIGILALAQGLNDVVRASIAGSVIGNSLLVLGTAMAIGGWRHRIQRFKAHDAGHYAALLALAVVGLVIPTMTAVLGGASIAGKDVPTPAHVQDLSNIVSILLLLAYLAYLAYSVFGVHAVRARGGAAEMRGPTPVEAPARGQRERRHQRQPQGQSLPRTGDQGQDEEEQEEGEEQTGKSEVTDPLPKWVPAPLHVTASVPSAVGWLGVATVLTAVASELLVGSIEPVAHQVGLSTFFIGLIVLPIVGNAGEHFSAITQAANNQMNATMAITAGSAIQVALLVAPVLVLVSVPLGHPLPLIFIPLELVIFTLVAFLYALVSLDGESTWIEGLLLLVFYVIVAASAFFVP